MSQKTKMQGLSLVKESVYVFIYLMRKICKRLRYLHLFYCVYFVTELEGPPLSL